MAAISSVCLRRFCLGVLAAAGFLAWLPRTSLAQDRPRLIVLTDFFKDPDDKQSMVRLFASANEFEIEGLIATSLAYGTSEVHPEWIREMVNEYAKVVDNLRLHERPGYEYPSAESLRHMVKAGAPVVRRHVGQRGGFPVPYPRGARDSRSCEPATKWIGRGKDTEGSEHIVRVVDRDDPRPVWVTVWGGAMDLAQAIWKVRNERSPAEASRFIGKLRVHQISWQDTGAVWIWENVPELFLIQNSDAHRGIYGKRFAGARDDEWLDEHVRRGHGPLGAAYPRIPSIGGIKEGDSPSFLHLMAAGLSDPEHPEWGGWGGRFARLDPERRFFVDTGDTHPELSDDAIRAEWTIGRWNEAASNDFAARMDWCVKSYADANHHPIVCVDSDATARVLNREVRSGETVSLDAAGTRDPDGDRLSYRWWHYVEAGSYGKAAEITDADSAKAGFVAPTVSERQTVHVILAVADDGDPPLTSYRRMVFTILP
ncbi:MAG: nucleoside hydrolase-like domain-containing protein [Planctomycetota bacterium]